MKTIGWVLLGKFLKRFFDIAVYLCALEVLLRSWYGSHFVGPEDNPWGYGGKKGAECPDG
ncbi:MAG: hypothetical protein FJY17_04325 [Bacteroidetes bacterium]|nr:hypothetical protein [Bacteroidota bacterium]